MSIDSLIDGVIGREGGLALSLSGQTLVVLPGRSSVVFQDKPLAVQLYEYVVSAVARLFGGSRPPAVAGLIVPVHADAVERRSGGSRSHVPNERRRIPLPFFAHRYAAPAIVRIFRIIWIVAPALRMIPRFEFRAGAIVNAVAVLKGSSANRFQPSASTTDLSPGADVIEANGSLLPAIATEKPFRLATAEAADRHQSTEALTRNIEGCNHVH